MQGLGYDLKCVRGSAVYHVEVKGGSGNNPQVILSRNEERAAWDDRQTPRIVHTAPARATHLPCEDGAKDPATRLHAGRVGGVPQGHP